MNEAIALGVGKLRQGAADFFAPSRADVHGQQVRLREIAVVVRFFLRSHGIRAARGLIPEARLLRNAPAALEDVDVTLDFVLQRLLQKAEGIEVFYFDLGAEFAGAARAHADVGVAAQRAFFHVAVADAGVQQDLAQRGQIRVSLFGRAHIRLGHDFAQRRAAAVVIDVGLRGRL